MYKEVILNTTLTENLCMEGLQNEINHLVARAKKEAEINPDDNIKISVLIAISFKDLSAYTKAENRRLNKNA